MHTAFAKLSTAKSLPCHLLRNVSQLKDTGCGAGKLMQLAL